MQIADALRHARHCILSEARMMPLDNAAADALAAFRVNIDGVLAAVDLADTDIRDRAFGYLLALSMAAGRHNELRELVHCHWDELTYRGIVNDRGGNADE